MTVTREDIAAYADGELAPERALQVEEAVERDPELAQQLAAHRALKDRLAGHFAPIAGQAVPEHLSAMLTRETAPVTDIAAAREKREARRRSPHWGWVAGPALAASLALAIFLPRGGTPEGYADAQLAGALDTQLVAEQPAGADTRILLSFRNSEGDYCRAFNAVSGSGIACRDAQGWKLEALGAGEAESTSDYRMAGADAGAIMAQAQSMANGPALDTEAEAAARATGWQ